MTKEQKHLLLIGRKFANIAFNYGQQADSPTLTSPTPGEWKILSQLRELQQEWDKVYPTAVKGENIFS